MGFLEIKVFGVALWILLSLMLSFLGFIFMLVYWQRERIRKKYYTIRFPEKTLRVIIHFETGLYKVYYRMIPPKDLFEIDKKSYYYDKDLITKEQKFFAKHKTDTTDSEILIVKNLFVRKEGKKELIHIGDTQRYQYFDHLKIKPKGSKYAEIHYVYNCPYPLNFDVSRKGLEFSSETLKQFIDNDLVGKLLTMQQERTLMMIILIAVALNVIATIFLLAKTMGWIK